MIARAPMAMVNYILPIYRVLRIRKLSPKHSSTTRSSPQVAQTIR